MITTRRPPRLAESLLNLFISKEQGSPIIGDLKEEFGIVASRKGLSLARWWYRRQVTKTLPHLFFRQLGTAPWETFAALAVGLAVLWLANMPMIAIRNYYPMHWPELVRLAWLVGYPAAALAIPPLLSGCLVAWLTKKRGLADTLLLSFGVAALRLAIVWFFPQHLPAPPPVWSLLWLRFTPFWLRLGDQLGVAIGPLMVLAGGLAVRRSEKPMICDTLEA